MKEQLKERTHWALTHGVARASLKLSAYRGDPTAKLLIDTTRARTIYPLIEQIRARGRMSLFGETTWVTADIALVRAILRDNRFVTVKPEDQPSAMRWLADKTAPRLLNPAAPPSILFTDPPDHGPLRRLVSAPFTPRAIADLRGRIQEVTDEHLRELEHRARPDLVADYTARIPIAVIGGMLAIPPAEHAMLHEVIDHGMKLITTSAPSWHEYRSATEALRELDDYLEMHVARLRRDDFADSILSGAIGSDALSHFETKIFAAVFLGAGFVTTTHLMGKAILALLRHPDQLAALRANPDGWPNAVEEVIRYDTSNQWSARIATETVDIDGYTVKAGQQALLLLGGANRDPAVFERPDTFDISRANAREHATFGTGVHVCLGAALARLELHIGLRSLFERFPRLALAGEPPFLDAMGIHGLRELPVALNSTLTAPPRQPAGPPALETQYVTHEQRAQWAHHASS